MTAGETAPISELHAPAGFIADCSEGHGVPPSVLLRADGAIEQEGALLAFDAS